MNKQDGVLLLILSIIIGVLFLGYTFILKKEGSAVKVYYENKLIKTINLQEDGIYHIDGALGDVALEIKKGQIRVTEEVSPYHLCQKQGWISKSFQTLICLPNKVVVKIEAKPAVDTITR